MTENLENDVELLKEFEESRNYLRAIAFRMLGSTHEADDALQEAWLRANRGERTNIINATGWLTTIVSHVCLDMLRSRRRRQAEVADITEIEPIVDTADNPTEQAAFAESVGLAVLVVLDRLGPAERVAFVLHDLFDIPFSDIASVLERSTDAAKKLASRARHRMYGAATVSGFDFTRQQQVVDAFLTASRSGDLNGLLKVLAPDVVRRADLAVLRGGKETELRGARRVSEETTTNADRAQFARPILVNGVIGVAVAPLGRLMFVLELKFTGELISEINVISETNRLHQLELAVIGEATVNSEVTDG